MTWTFLLTAFVICVTPGTGALFTLAAALGRGARAGLVAAFACTIGTLPHLLAAVTGLAALLQASGVAFQVVKYAGVAYLLWMAWSTWRDTGALKVGADDRPASVRSVIVSGIGVNLLNPKLTIFFFAFLPQFVPAGSDSQLALDARSRRGLRRDDLRGLRGVRPGGRGGARAGRSRGRGSSSGSGAGSPPASSCSAVDWRSSLADGALPRGPCGGRGGGRRDARLDRGLRHRRRPGRQPRGGPGRAARGRRRGAPTSTPTASRSGSTGPTARGRAWSSTCTAAGSSSTTSTCTTPAAGGWRTGPGSRC